MLTDVTERLCGEPRKGLWVCAAFCERLDRRGCQLARRASTSGPHPRQKHVEAEQSKEQECVEKQVVSHVVPPSSMVEEGYTTGFSDSTIIRSLQGHDRVQTLSEVLLKAAESARLPFNYDGSVTSVTTGLRSLHLRLGGLQPSDLMILAGRACARPRLPPAHTFAASPTDIGGNAARRDTQTQGRGLFNA
jgi:hypothetical protein